MSHTHTHTHTQIYQSQKYITWLGENILHHCTQVPGASTECFDRGGIGPQLCPPPPLYHVLFVPPPWLYFDFKIHFYTYPLTYHASHGNFSFACGNKTALVSILHDCKTVTVRHTQSLLLLQCMLYPLCISSNSKGNTFNKFI